MKLSDPIEKQKGVPDLKTVRNIFKALKNGGTVGLFPEGSVTWDGRAGKVYPGIGKLINRSRVPVVGAKIHGGYLTKPRWAKKRRKGTIEIDFGIFEDDEVLNFIFDSEWEWQRSRNYIYDGKKRALGLERLMWFCPECGTYRTVKASGNEALCSKCHSKFVVDRFGYIDGKGTHVIIDKQIDLLKSYIKDFEKIRAGIGKVIIRRRSNGDVVGKFRGLLFANKDGIRVGNKHFQMEKIRGLSTFLKRFVEFVYEDNVVMIRTEFSSLLVSKYFDICCN
ncbi:MAG: lysophospholipid acyltransferase family protein [Kosmotogaceae bacterium]